MDTPGCGPRRQTGSKKCDQYQYQQETERDLPTTLVCPVRQTSSYRASFKGLVLGSNQPEFF